MLRTIIFVFFLAAILAVAGPGDFHSVESLALGWLLLHLLHHEKGKYSTSRNSSLIILYKRGSEKEP
jgi:hypothetical protein